MIGKTIIEPGRVDSTNNLANQLLAKGPVEEGVVIRADEQFAGRGQQGHNWESEAGKNLTFSVILKPSFLAPDRQFLLNKLVSLAVVDYIEAASRISHPASRIPHPQISIKWPNDIYAGDRKIAGILIENKIMGSSLETCIAGIGININQTRFSPDIPNPVSLSQIIHAETELKAALKAVCRFLDLRYTALRQGGPATPDLEYDQRLLGYELWRKFIHSRDQFEGKIKGVDELGRLVIETRTGKILGFNHREIEFIL
jgi:BirA family transcriptional regulator, biotin operon repressor / biotin---[acetyl-CoA-carboxylase] ligase